jgi:hypothetical protein
MTRKVARVECRRRKIPCKRDPDASSCIVCLSYRRNCIVKRPIPKATKSLPNPSAASERSQQELHGQPSQPCIKLPSKCRALLDTVFLLYAEKKIQIQCFSSYKARRERWPTYPAPSFAAISPLLIASVAQPPLPHTRLFCRVTASG